MRRLGKFLALDKRFLSFNPQINYSNEGLEEIPSVNEVATDHTHEKFVMNTETSNNNFDNVRNDSAKENNDTPDQLNKEVEGMVVGHDILGPNNDDIRIVDDASNDNFSSEHDTAKDISDYIGKSNF